MFQEPPSAKRRSDGDGDGATSSSSDGDGAASSRRRAMIEVLQGLVDLVDTT